jgi:hypothetical protein
MESIQTVVMERHDTHTYIIIDALDECPNTEDEKSDLCSILKEMHAWEAAKLHVLVSSRKEADLTGTLLPLLTQEPISIQGSAVDKDIRKFVQTQLRTDTKLSK